MSREPGPRGGAPTVPVAEEKLREAVAVRPALPVGTVLAGRYRIERFVARGGMGAVYAARDLELDVDLAVKTIRPELAWSNAVIEDFKRETQLAREVTHPAVCRIFDLGRHGEGEASLVFLTMELLAGETLAERLARGPMPEADAVPVIEQIVAGLAAAHAAGVVHRDLKPGNVLLVPREGDGVRAVITDFGLAHQVDAGGAETVAVGTPEYMAPEQQAGEAVGPRADVYALGKVMRETAAALPARWEAIVTRCLASRPEDRPRDAREVAAMLAPVPRGRGWLAAVVVAVTLLLAAAVAAATLWPSPSAPIDRSQPRGAEARAAYHDGVARLRDGDDVKAAERLRAAIVAEPDFALAHAELAAALRALGDLAAARAAAERASSLAGSLGREHALVIEARLDEVHRRWPQAVERYLELVRKAPDDAELRLRLAYAQLAAGALREGAATIADLRARGVTHPRVDYLEAYLASRNGDWPALREATARVSAAADRIGAARMAALAWTEQGNAHLNLGDEASAVAAIDEASRRFVALGDLAGQARVGFVRAQITAQRDHAAARAELDAALALYRRAGNRDGEAMTLSALANFAPADRIDHAIALYEQALAIYRDAGDVTNRDNTLFNLATLHYKLGDHTRTRATFEDVLASGRTGGVAMTVALATINLAAITLQEADPPRAQVLLDEASAAARGLADPTVDAYVRWLRGEIAAARADDTAATRELAAAIELAPTSIDPAPVEQARCALARLQPGADVASVCLAASARLAEVGAVDAAIILAWHAARGHLGRGRRADARAILPRIEELAAQSHDRHTALTARLARAELTGNGDVSALAEIAADAEKTGARQLAYEARFARGLALVAAGQRTAGGDELAALEAEAESRSMTAIARRSRAARRR